MTGQWTLTKLQLYHYGLIGECTVKGLSSAHTPFMATYSFWSIFQCNKTGVITVAAAMKVSSLGCTSVNQTVSHWIPWLQGSAFTVAPWVCRVHTGGHTRSPLRLIGATLQHCGAQHELQTQWSTKFVAAGRSDPESHQFPEVSHAWGGRRERRGGLSPLLSFSYYLFTLSISFAFQAEKVILFGIYSLKGKRLMNFLNQSILFAQYLLFFL